MRTVVGDERWSREFFEELREPETLVVVGDVTIEPGVTRDVLRDRGRGLVLVGTLRAPRELAVMHDFELARTTNGEGFVQDRAWPYIESLDAGGWYAPHFGALPGFPWVNVSN